MMSASPPHPFDAAGPRPSFGPYLAQLRLRRGWSQLRLAEQLCAASGSPTVTRHEVSRWEREDRLPADFWLGWLAAVLDVPVDGLAEAAERSRVRHRLSAPGRAGPGQPDGGVPVGLDLLGLAHTWLAGDEPPLIGPPRAAPPVGAETGGSTTAELTARLTAMRRLDDVAGGADLLSAVRRLATATAEATTAPAGTAPSRRTLRLRAEVAQLKGWTLADAGDPAGALAAYRSALAAAVGAGDRPFAGHVLGSASHLLAGSGQPAPALLLARTAYAGARRALSASGRALLLHRIAFAAASAGLRGPAEAALTAAQRASERLTGAHDPPWLYWLDEGELDALAGRCLVALGRPARALPLLSRAAERSGQPRTAALDKAWLARARLDAGEAEGAALTAGAAVLDTIRSGSTRAVDLLGAFGDRLAPHGRLPAARDYAELLVAARPYLPRPLAGEAVAHPRAAGDG
ncbi:helix-turn-helix domain-containing protein [Asanoa sp. WMMD1127]|uniref:helix-turn-helix domain-containing protein n=1 Tax=Asanoa sp. WMMD1127 TaxID=3016107 RepID=UPI002415BA1C|nr:helix-turn-helix domain-containing protein [Asanoa sp. WMMD1127]MDG4827113.1 helix-turn-helix domain-containing protein [Asanoa sp. WMMD1127]